MNHTCHATGCDAHCLPRFLMCPRHWAMVPEDVQRHVYANYRNGQCDDGKPNEAWFEWAHTAIAFVADREGMPLSKRQRRLLNEYRVAHPALWHK